MRVVKLNNSHPTLPNKNTRVPLEENTWAGNRATQWGMAYFRTQPEYRLDQLLWDNVLDSFNMPRDWNALVRTVGTDGYTLHLSIVHRYRQHREMRPEAGQVTRQSIRDRATILFTENVFRELDVCSPRVKTAAYPGVIELLSNTFPYCKKWLRVTERD